MEPLTTAVHLPGVDGFDRRFADGWPYLELQACHVFLG